MRGVVASKFEELSLHLKRKFGGIDFELEREQFARRTDFQPEHEKSSETTMRSLSNKNPV